MMKKDRKFTYGVIIVIVVAIGVFTWNRMTDPARETVSMWRDTGIECLVGGHQRLGQHIHPELRIIIDGVEEIISAEIGIVPTCMSEVHTHDSLGTIHAESVSSTKEFRLKDFFSVWGRDLERPGYTLVMTVDGQPSDASGELIFKDRQKIIITYTAN